jgi:hypothetical protein
MAISNNHNSAPAVGHGSGSGNGGLNNNRLDISLFSWKKGGRNQHVRIRKLQSITQMKQIMKTSQS